MALMISIIEPIITSKSKFLPFDRIAKVAPTTMVGEVASSWSVALTKTSIALLLVRLQPARAWTVFFYTIIGVQVLTAIFVTVLQTTRCIPTEAIWNPAITDKWCWSAEAFKVTMTAASSVVITTDVIFTIIPLTFLHHIRSSLLHRIVIAVLMGLGLLASAASVVKTVMVHRFDQGSDASGNGLAIALWASIEAQVGIIAACIPCLRAPFLRLLGRIGLYRKSNGGYAMWLMQEPSRGHAEYAGSAMSHPPTDQRSSNGPSTSIEISPDFSQDKSLRPGSAAEELSSRIHGRKSGIGVEVEGK